ncbi:MAG TPA: arginine N-succinyltransferase [Solimonas sp.]|nr:arginine N-succinyltransferase [Solimonas sp.]
MDLVRPIRLDDLDALLALARAAGTGFTSLPPQREVLRQKIERSLASFAAEVSEPGHERYMFVLEDGASGAVGGCCAVEAACGLDEPFYNYHVGTTVHASHALGVYKRVPTLYLSNDLTGTSVLCSLFLHPDFRRGRNGLLLSKSRFLFMAGFPQRFSVKVIAEMRGVSDERGVSPFWEGLGRHFFHIEYGEAEHIVGQGNKACIAELMPKHPIYTVLLPPAAQTVLGQVHRETAPALRLLEQEGFRYQHYIDIFDGGPAVEAPLAEIRSVRRSRVLPVTLRPQPGPGSPHLVATTTLAGYRCLAVELETDAEHVVLSPAQAHALQVQAGDRVRISPLAQETGVRS